MAPDSNQQAGQADSSQPHFTIEADLMRFECQCDRRHYLAKIGISLLLLLAWIYFGVKTSLPWTWYLAVPVIIWGVGFMLAYHLRHRQKPIELGEPLLDCAERSLTEVEDQIWMTCNTFWWYTLPLGISIAAYLAHTAWLESKSIGGSCVLVVFVFAVWYFIYWVDQHTIRSRLEPRRQKLLTLLTSLRDETASGGSQVGGA